jgi:hypothetical protein
MKCKWYQFHDWIDIKQMYDQEFEGTMCTYSYTKYRICRKCNTITEKITYGIHGYDRDLTECETKIVLEKAKPIFSNNVLAHYEIPKKNVKTKPKGK